MWSGMNRRTGTHCTELEHIRQSVADILTTPLATRVMRRDYGSLLPSLIDQPFNGVTRQRMLAAVVIALTRWEPRIRINRIAIEIGDAPGEAQVIFDAERSDGGRSTVRVSLTGR